MHLQAGWAHFFLVLMVPCPFFSQLLPTGHLENRVQDQELAAAIGTVQVRRCRKSICFARSFRIEKVIRGLFGSLSAAGVTSAPLMVHTNFLADSRLTAII